MAPFKIEYGDRTVAKLMTDLIDKHSSGKISKAERQYLKKLSKCFGYLESDPRHPGLQSHEIDTLSQKYDVKVWQSYLENNTPAAGRVFWVYGPTKGQITVVGIEDHPKKGRYSDVRLDLPAKNLE